MRRRSPPKSQAGGVSLFPFLAVLLCTMGALIVVLIVIARQARIQVAEDDDDAPLRKELETQKADLQWRIDMLRESRTKTLAQLDAQRQELSHLEDHSRRLRSQLEELEQARREFAKLAAGDDVETDRLRREIDEVGAKIAAKERELDEAIRSAGRGPSYAIVPYHGPNETRRRPIYIECRAEGVVLQPEGLLLTEKDFMIDLGPSNPLVSALRAAREYLSRNQRPGEEGAAYPLVLVRPDGVDIYEMVYAAMEAWKSEFGYELIDDDWSLEFPPADPKLTLAMRQAIGEGRLRQAYLAHAAPRLRSSGHHSFRASPTGGIMRDDGMPLDAEQQMASRGAFGARPDFARTRGGGGSGQGKAAIRRNGNPYAAALGKSPNGNGAGGGGSGTAQGSGDGSLLGLGAGDLAGGQLNAEPGSPTGVRISAPNAGHELGGGRGDSLLGSGQGPSAIAAGGLSAAGGAGFGGATDLGGAQPGAGGVGAAGQRYAGRGAGPFGAPGRGGAGGAAPGTRGVRGRRGRGWGAAQDQIDALAASLGAAPRDAFSATGRGDGSSSGRGSSGRGSSGRASSGQAAAGQAATGQAATGQASAGRGAAGSATAANGNLGAGTGTQSSDRRGSGPAGKPGDAAAGKRGAPGTGAPSGQGGPGSGDGRGEGDALAADLGAASGAALAANAPGRSSPGRSAAGGSAGRGAAGDSKAASDQPGAGASGDGDAESTSEGGSDGAVADTSNGAGPGGASGKPGGKSGGKSGNAASGSEAGSSATAGSSFASAGSSSKGSSLSSGGSPAGQSGGGMAGNQSGGGSAGNQSGGSAGAQGSPGAASSSPASSFAQPQQGGMPMPIPMPNMTLGQNSQQKSIAEQRGEKNWANPAANRAASPVTRPIKIVCDADHLTMLPEGRSRRGYKVIELGENNEENMRELVTSVWDRIDSWGVAGQGNYWRPELIMEVEPGAEARFNELKALMADSGLDVRGRPRATAAVRYPRTKTPN